MNGEGAAHQTECWVDGIFLYSLDSLKWLSWKGHRSERRRQTGYGNIYDFLPVPASEQGSNFKAGWECLTPFMKPMVTARCKRSIEFSLGTLYTSRRTGWLRRIELRKLKYSQCCLGDVLVKSERHLPSPKQYKVCIKSPWTVVWFSQIVYFISDYQRLCKQLPKLVKLQKLYSMMSCLMNVD